MADFMRKMIEEMMGHEALDGQTHTAISFDNPKVCRSFLEGMCVHELFVNTKLDRGECDKVHSQKLKDEYEKAKEQNKDISVIEMDLERQLSSFVTDCDRRIRAAQERVAQEPGPEKTTVLATEIAELESKIQEMSQKAEAFGEEGEVDKAMEVMTEIDEIKKLKSDKENELRTMTAHDISSNLRMRVCEVCGAFLAATDDDKRIADHFIGKMHVGYQKIRALLSQLRERLGKNRRGGGYYRSRDRSRERKLAPSRRGSDRDLHRDRDYDRYRHRSRSRDRRRRSRSRDRYSRSRSRDRFRHGRGGRSRSRSRERKYEYDNRSSRTYRRSRSRSISDRDRKIDRSGRDRSKDHFARSREIDSAVGSDALLPLHDGARYDSALISPSAGKPQVDKEEGEL